MSFLRSTVRAISSLILALAMLGSTLAPLVAQATTSTMACCKRSKAACCCHQDKAGVVKIKTAGGCEGGCRYGALSTASDASFPLSLTASAQVALVTVARTTARRLFSNDRRFDVTRFQRPPPISL